MDARRRASTTLLVAIVGCLGALVGVATGHEGGHDARKRVHYCTRHSHPRGCVRVPQAAKRPTGTNQQGSAALTPTDVENGGGLGGGPGDHRRSAVAWAKTQLKLGKWAWRCERFVEEAFGTRDRFATAVAAQRAIPLHVEPVSAAPRGSLVFFAPDRYNQHWGHVGLSLGGGKMLSALTSVMVTDVAHSPYWRRLYVGWADAPAEWPGRLPPLPDAAASLPPTPDISVRITAPAANQTIGGVVPLVASASNADGVAFDAFYATDPRDDSTLGWHPLGNGQRDGSSWVLDWNTQKIPDQGFNVWGTVNVAATALQAGGQRTGTRDYRRVNVSNLAPVTNPVPTTPVPTNPVTTTTTTPQPPPTTHAETVGGNANTWSDYMSAGGTKGAVIPAGATIQVRCRVQGFRVADGNVWWYRIASSPWDDGFYASADAFYNNGATSGSLAGTPFYDPAVPTC